MCSAERRVRRVTLFNTALVHAKVGVYRKLPVIDELSGQQVGTAQRSHPGFVLRDADDRIVLRVVRRKRRSWDVFGADAAKVGSIVAAPPPVKEGFWARRRELDPWTWLGSVVVDDEEVALVQAGAVVDRATRRRLAELTLSQPSTLFKKRSSAATWRLAIADRVEGPLRVMALAWLGAAFDLQRDIDTSD